MASRNGLNPKIRGPKGVGYGRALPSAFGFGNGILPPGNGYLNVLPLAGKIIPHQWTIEFWVKPDTNINSYEGWIQYNDNYPSHNGEGNGAEIRLQGQLYPYPSFQFAGDTAGVGIGVSLPGNIINNVRNHIVFTVDMETGVSTSILNGNVGTKAIGTNIIYTNPYLGVFQFFYLFTLTTQGLYATKLMDEFRMYTEVLSDADILTNYNSGIGNNPVRTENLFVWYQFEQFETLDFSLIQDGSDIRLGLRDMSGKNNHALPINMDINTTSETYVLQRF